jgi:hypothetical protein
MAFLPCVEEKPPFLFGAKEKMLIFIYIVGKI